MFGSGAKGRFKVEAKVIRANGSVEDLGTIYDTYKPWHVRLWNLITRYFYK